MKFEIRKVEIWEYEKTQLYDDYLEELDKIIEEVEYCDYVHNEETNYDEITSEDLKTYQGYYWE